MRLRTLAVAAGLVGGIAWLGKLAVMGVQGGPDPASVPEAIAFFAGLLGVLVAAAATGSYRARERSIGHRIGYAAAAVVATILVVGVGQLALSALPGDGWLREEGIFGIVGIVAIAGALVALRTHPRTNAVARDAS